MLNEPENNNLIRPEHLQARYKIGKSTYYKRTRYLNIKSQKDEYKKVYLTPEQITQLDHLHTYIQTHGTMIGFKTSQIIDKNSHSSSIVPSSAEEAQAIILPSPVVESEEIKESDSCDRSNNFPKALRPTALIV